MKTEELKALGLNDEQVQRVFAMNGADVNREKQAAATAYTDQTVTFTVKDNAESSPNAIAGAAVNVNGSIRLTGTDGTAVFHLRAGEYPYSVKADGYRPQTGTVTVAAAAVPVAVTLPASK